MSPSHYLLSSPDNLIIRSEESIALTDAKPDDMRVSQEDIRAAHPEPTVKPDIEYGKNPVQDER